MELGHQRHPQRQRCQRGHSRRSQLLKQREGVSHFGGAVFLQPRLEAKTAEFGQDQAEAPDVDGRIEVLARRPAWSWRRRLATRDANGTEGAEKMSLPILEIRDHVSTNRRNLALTFFRAFGAHAPLLGQRPSPFPSRSHSWLPKTTSGARHHKVCAQTALARARGLASRTLPTSPNMA